MTSATALRSRHLLGIAGVEPDEIELILQTALAMKEIATRSVKKVPTLRGRTVVNLFFEASTRTRFSFEAAMHRLGGQVLSAENAARASSAAKGESLEDAIRNRDLSVAIEPAPDNEEDALTP